MNNAVSDIGLSALSIERSGVTTTAAGHNSVAQAHSVAHRDGIPAPRTAFLMQSTARLDGESVTALFDTAAQANFVSAAFLDKVGWQARVQPGCAGTRATAANGTEVPVTGMATFTLLFDGRGPSRGHESRIECVVADLEAGYPLIIGEPWLKRFKARLSYQ